MESSFRKGLMKAAGVSHHEDLRVLVTLLPPPPGGRRGWMKDWAAEARAIRDKDLIAAARAAAEEKAAAKAAALAVRQAAPVWGIEPEYGSYSFSNELYGFRVVEGGGTLTYQEALDEAEAAKARHAKRIDRANADWHDFINF